MFEHFTGAFGFSVFTVRHIEILYYTRCALSTAFPHFSKVFLNFFLFRFPFP